MKIVFLGTPDFAVPALENLIASGQHQVLAVVTQPDKERNRGVLSFSPVKECALRHGLRVLQYQKIRAEGVSELQSLGADIMITCAYGQILSKEILDIAPYGIINVHASLLPKYRGSSPIQQAVLNGEKHTGITVMQTAEGLDCGDILLQVATDIKDGETAGELFDRLSVLGASVLIDALKLIENGEITRRAQDESQATYYPMLRKENGLIDWQKDAQKLIYHIAGMNPWPSAFSYLNGKLFKIWKAELADITMNDASYGQIKVIDKEAFVKCGSGALRLLQVQAEGKNRMNIEDFLRGNKTLDGERLG